MSAEKAVDKICAYCNHFTFLARKPKDREYGQAFCRKHEKWFPDQKDGTPAGKRTCQYWE